MRSVRPSTVLLWIVIAVLAAALVLDRRRSERRLAALEIELYRARLEVSIRKNYPDSYFRQDARKKEFVRNQREVNALQHPAKPADE